MLMLLKISLNHIEMCSITNIINDQVSLEGIPIT